MAKVGRSKGFSVLVWAAIALSLSWSSLVEAAWMGSEWQYRRAITIHENSRSTLTDYQVLVVLDTASLIDEGKMQDDCDDIRFTDSDGVTQLNYWLEGPCDSTDTKVWVKVPRIPAGSEKKIYVYYGNPGAVSQSDAEGVFELYDDFESLDTDKWEVSRKDGDASVECVAEGGYLKLVRQSLWKGCNIKAKNFNVNYDSEYAVEFKFSINYRCGTCNDGDGIALVIDGKDNSAGWACEKGFGSTSQGIVVEIFDDASTTSSNNGIGIDSDTTSCSREGIVSYWGSGWDKRYDLNEGIISAKLNGSHIVVEYQDLNPTNGLKRATLQTSVWNPNGNGYLMLGAGAGCSDCEGGGCSSPDSGHWVDWIRVRKYTYPEPSVSVSAEERPVSSCETLDEEGVYVLTTDIMDSSTSPCIDIQANNVIFDCENHLIDGDDSAEYGIYISRSSQQTTNVTIKNCRVSDWSSANIYLYNANGNILENITAYSGDDGIWLSSSNSNVLISITTYSNSNNGIALGSSDSNTLINITTYSNNLGGIYLISSSHNRIINCSADSNGINIWIFFHANNNTVKGCRATNSLWGWSIYLQANSNNRILDCDVSHSGNGIYFYTGANNNTVANCRVHDNSWSGITINGAHFNTLLNVTTYSNGQKGIYLKGGASSNTLTNITAYSNSRGIYIDDSSNNNILSNILAHSNGIGVAIISSSNDNTLSNVVTHSNSGSGVYVDSSSSNTLSDIVTYSNGYGIFFSRSTSSTLANITTYSNSLQGIWLIDSNSNTLTNVVAYSNEDGIRLSNSHTNTLSNITTYSNNNHGIYLYDSDSNTLTNVNASDNAYYDVLYLASFPSYCSAAFENVIGTSNKPIVFYNHSVTIKDWNNNVSEIILCNADNSLIDNLNMEGGGNDGLILTGGTESTTIRNSKFRNLKSGIYLYYASNNLIYNNLFNNSKNIDFGTTYENHWNVTRQFGTRIYPPVVGEIGGNFWAKPDGTGYSETCSDSDRDGFCDNPYNLATDNTDYLPLTFPPTPSMNITLNLTPGWNLVSIPYVKVKSILFDDCGIENETLYYLNRSVEKWEKVTWKGLLGGRGYWYHNPHGKVCRIKVEGSSTIDITHIPPLKKGYNLIGATWGGFDISTHLGTCSLEPRNGRLALYWNPSTKKWEPTNFLERGRGYWVYANGDCSLS